MIQQRDYQLKVQDAITTAFANGKKRVLLTMPTGSGKSLVALVIAIHASKNGHRALIWAPRREICHQMGSILRSMGVDFGLILADEPHDPTLPIQIASIQSLYVKGIRRKNIDMPKADVVIHDEGHHSLARTHQKVIAAYPDAYHLAMTATPVNKCGAGLGTFFDHIIVGPSISELTQGGYLVPVKYYIPSKPDLEGLRAKAGDYIEGELAKRVDQVKLIGDICENWSRVCPNRKTIVSACGIAHSQHIANRFNELGVKAAHLDGRMPARERDRIVMQYVNNEVQVLCNADLFSEGADFPDVSCLIFARPTKSLGRFLQICGRGLRPFPGKENLILLDHGAAIYEHGVLDQNFDWRLDYGKDKTINKARQKQKDKAAKRWITCETCALVYTSRLQCPECGTIPKAKGKPVATFEAYLIAMDEADRPPEIDPKTFYLALKGYAVQKNYNIGWAAHKYKAKFKTWPGSMWKYLQAIEPPLEVKSWIRAEQMRWAASQGRSGQGYGLG